MEVQDGSQLLLIYLFLCMIILFFNYAAYIFIPVMPSLIFIFLLGRKPQEADEPTSSDSHVTLFFKELLSLIENLRAKLVAERRRNMVQEMEIRKEMGDAMIQQILESEEKRRWERGMLLLFFRNVYLFKSGHSRRRFVYMMCCSSRQIEELKESYQVKMENTFEMYKDAVKEHAYQSAMNNLLDDYVSLDEFVAEQEKVEVSRCCDHY